MDAGTQEHEIEAGMHDAELATLYGGVDEVAAPYPLLVEPWEDEPWDSDSELDPQIYAGLLRLAP